MLLYTRVAPPKVPKKRSRAGCNYCKEKKKKCDETRPQCARCQEREQDCVYEPIRPRQRRKREHLSVDTESPAPPPGVSIHQWRQQRRRQGSDELDEEDEESDEQQWTNEKLPDNGADGHIMHVPLATPSTASDVDTVFTWSAADAAAFSPLTPMTSTSYDLSGPDGQLTAKDDADDVEEVVRQDQTMQQSYPLALAHRRQQQQQRHQPTSHGQLQRHYRPPSPTLEFCPPVFAEFSQRKNRRHLVDHFCNVLSHLIVFREEYGNPFQQLVLPLSNSSPAVMDTIYALASAHLEFRGVQNVEKSEYFHGRAIQELARLIEQGGGANRNELLAAIMLLVYYEVLVQKGRSNIVDGHLKGAMSIMSNREASTDPTSVFLERAFRFYDVIAALSFGTAPLLTAPGSGSLSQLPPLDSRGATSPVGSVDTLLGMATTLWPVIHRLSNLVCVKDDLDAAVSQGLTSKATVLRTELETTASAIQVALNQWRPLLPPETATTPAEHARLQSILNNALAYRHSAFVYLFRTIYGHARSHALVQRHAHLSLVHCVGTVTGEGPMSALLWPLFVAACEAMSPVDRGLASQAFMAIDRTQGMINIERSWQIVQEVWRRADEIETREAEEQSRLPLGELRRLQEAEMENTKAGTIKKGSDLWRKVSREMGVTIVFG